MYPAVVDGSECPSCSWVARMSGDIAWTERAKCLPVHTGEIGKRPFIPPGLGATLGAFGLGDQSAGTGHPTVDLASVPTRTSASIGRRWTGLQVSPPATSATYSVRRSRAASCQ